MEFINKDTVVTEIEERIETYKKGYAEGDDRRADALDVLLHDFNAIEVKEVDLENAVGKWLDDNCDDTGYFNQLDFAKHFFELGLKTQKE